ncbi:MAG: flagellar biosynthetic protein FliR [Candidatus Neomarinimicrobiota bacterium]
MPVIAELQGMVPQFMLILTRLTALLTTLPIFSYGSIPPRVRVMLAFVLAVIMLPLFGAGPLPEFTGLLDMLLAMTREMLIGLIIGFSARLIFEGFSMAGSFIAIQTGFQMANVMDPSTDQQEPIISHLWILLMTTIFLVADGHHLLIETLYANFRLIPLGTGQIPPAVGQTLIEGGSQAFDIAIRFAAPALVFFLLVDVAIGFIARVMPQMNIFMVAFPLKSGLGIFFLIISLNIFPILYDVVYSSLGEYTSAMMQLLGQD